MSNKKYIQVQDVLQMESIQGYYPSLDSMSGCLEWNNGEDIGKYLYATPNWEEEGKCPVSIYTEEGDYNDVALLRFTDVPIEDQLTQYRACLDEVISTFSENKR
tara:strand:+ start:158 stop:469 length:312 start_codon:yes stop_codon:yes gene_type:complete